MPTSSRYYWYNHNLVIVANIERRFLGPDDLKEIHYHFGKHRKKSAMITHLKIQYALGGIAALFIFTTSSEESCREFTPQQEISSFPEVCRI